MYSRHLARHVLASPFRRFLRYQSSSSAADISALLSKPSWSVKSLLPPSDKTTNPVITPTQLRHLLRLSALPQPRTPEEEADMLKTLSSQIHFVKEVQAVDTTGVKPLRALRDETAEGIKESTIGLEQMQESLNKEETVGRNGRIRRKKDVKHEAKTHFEHWDPMELAQEKRGRYFVVKREKPAQSDASLEHGSTNFPD